MTDTRRPCHLLGCTRYGRLGHHHHFVYGHENTTACHCDRSSR